ncbi:MAG TPA: hypothetical protein PKU78_01935 [Candidatus Dojkabacteria bacterium]|nr:hypothetical protein [Candidatus Dojkabacteria bacterium]
MKTLVQYTKRPYIYAVMITIGIMALYSILHTSSAISYFAASISLYTLLLFELYSTKFYATTFDDQFELTSRSKKHRKAHWVHHLIMPTVLFVSIVLFVFANSQLNMALVIALISLVLFSILFLNIKAYYENKYKLENKTANVYDVISIASVFMLAFSIFVVTALLGELYIISGLMNTAVLIILGYLTLARYHIINKQGGMMLFAMLLVYFNSFLALLNFDISIVAHTILTTFVYYYFTAVVNHYEEKSLDLKVIIEYLAVFVIIFVIIILGHI